MKLACSTDATPALIARLIASVPCACAATLRCHIAASSTTAFISSCENCGAPDRLLLREHAGAGDQLDHVGAALDLGADELADLVDAVGDAGKAVELEVGREPAEVAVAAGRADRERGRDDARALDVARGRSRFRSATSMNSADADVAHRGEAGIERALGVEVREDRGVDRAPPEVVLVVVGGLAGDVGVGVDEAGQERHAAELDHLGVPSGIRRPAPTAGDPLPLDQHDRVRHRRTAAPVDQSRRANRQALGRGRVSRAWPRRRGRERASSSE